MNNHKSYREESRRNWGANQDENLNREQLQLGCLLRIADALEKVSESYPFRELDNLRTERKCNLDRIKKLERSNAAYRGIIRRKKL